jgi:ppGpp synthetase/RelA/SpoT-type nucleotidyltranferase
VKSLSESYVERRKRVLSPLAERLAMHLDKLFEDFGRIDRISVRAKSVDRFVAKAEKQENGKRKYDDPLNQIQDQVGARIVTFYASDVERVRLEIEKYFRYIESKKIVPESESEFGYEGRHFILFVPEDLIDEKLRGEESVEFFELQIKTLFQHAWSEAEHDLGYKPSGKLTSEQRRRLAFTAAQAWGADEIFDEMHRQVAQPSIG